MPVADGAFYSQNDANENETMDALLEKLLINGSPLVVLVVIVVVFLRFMANEGKEIRAMLAQMHTDHLEARKESLQAVDRNTAAMMDSSAAASKLANAVENWVNK